MSNAATRRRVALGTAVAVSMLVAAASPIAPAAAQNVVAVAGKYIPRLERNLRENVLKFWTERCLDTTYGGYVINFGPTGAPNGLSSKMIVTQARMVWLFSRLARADYAPAQHLEAATHGYRFLKEKMWDATHGGFFWEVDQTGARKLQPEKRLYGQAFGLSALSEYYRTTRDEEARAWAIALFELLDHKAHDKEYGGYIESWTEDWAPLREHPGGVTLGRKTMNTHLHLLQAMTAFYEITHLPRARERLIELINIESNAVLRKDWAACTNQYDRDWTPRLVGDGARVTYGHDLENISSLIRACAVAGMPPNSFSDLYRSVFEYSLQHGYDAEYGGFYESGVLGQPADRRSKVWWVQAEAFLTALYMYKYTHDPKYLTVFTDTYDWIDAHQTDWLNGEWYAYVTPDGRGWGDKGTIWKAGYHNGRALIEGLVLLRQMAK